MWSIVWWLFLLIFVAVFFAGWIVSFFVMRNNPKYFGIDKMLKSERDALYGLGKTKLLMLQAKIADTLKQLT